MWITKTILDFITVGKDTVDALRVENQVLRAKNDIVERELIAARVNSDWMRLQINQLQIERTALLEKAYPGLHVPTLEIARVANKVQNGFDLTSLFEDQGEPAATQASN